MRQVFFLMLSSALLSACAGNPPAWWNPGNRYGTTQESAAPAAAPVKRTTPVVREEKLDLQDESYEEITLTPMPDEDGENATGVAASQNEELLPDALPVPSVL